MQVIQMKMGEKTKKPNGIFVRMTKDEALMLIESLASQILKKDPNSTRQEFYSDTGMYFTISVNEYLPGEME